MKQVQNKPCLQPNIPGGMGQKKEQNEKKKLQYFNGFEWQNKNVWKIQNLLGYIASDAVVKFFLYVKEIHNWILGEFQKPHCIMVSFFFISMLMLLLLE